MWAARFIATCFGIGYIQKGAGTVAALFCCLLVYFLRSTNLIWVELLVLLTVFSVGVFVSNLVEKEWGKDSSKVVIDEVLGMLMSLLLIPPDWKYFLIAFVLFRFFDIAKPLFIRRAESLPSGWGVMLDDLLAGIYTNVILHVLLKSHLF